MPIKKIKIYARISRDEKESIIDFDEKIKELAKRWNTSPASIYSSISHGQKSWEKTEIEDYE